MKILLAFLMCTLAINARAESTNKPTATEDIKRESKEAFEATKAYTEQQAKEFNKKAEAQFHELGKKLDEWKAKADKQTGQAKADLDKKIAEAQMKADELKPKLDQLKSATSNVWNEVKSGFERGLDDLKKALQ
jgi:DNA anti-recombination protein RmuC